MDEKSMKTFIKGRVKELLKTVEAFEKDILEGRERFTEAQKNVQITKKLKPESTYLDVESDLKTMNTSHYRAFMLEQNLKHILILLSEFNTMATMFDVDLGLEGDDKTAMDEISKVSGSLFTVDKDSKVVFINEEARKMVEDPINKKIAEPKLLEGMFADIPAAK